MPEPIAAYVEPLLREALPHRSGYGGNILSFTSLFIGFAIAALLSYDGWGQHLVLLEPAINIIGQRMQLAQPARAWHFRRFQRVWPLQSTEDQRLTPLVRASKVVDAPKYVHVDGTEYKVVDGPKYVRKVMERLEHDTKDGRLSHDEAIKALHDIAKAPFEYGLKTTFAKSPFEQTGALLSIEQKQDAYDSFNPVEKLMFWWFSLSVARQVGEGVEPATNYSNLIGQINSVARSDDLRYIQLKSKTAFLDMFPDFLLPAYKVLFAPFMELNIFLIAWVTRLSSQWLMGPSEVVANEREDGKEGKNLVLKIEKCRFLEESGPCVKTCLHACKVPTQEFFMEEMGLPVTLKPNMSTLGCEIHFGVAPIPLKNDPVAMTPCFATCQLKARHTDACA